MARWVGLAGEVVWTSVADALGEGGASKAFDEDQPWRHERSGSNSSSAADAFVRRVLAVVARIPAGRVATYGDVAVLAGKPGAARAVGNIMARADVPAFPTTG